MSLNFSFPCLPLKKRIILHTIKTSFCMHLSINFSDFSPIHRLDFYSPPTAMCYQNMNLLYFGYILGGQSLNIKIITISSICIIFRNYPSAIPITCISHTQKYTRNVTPFQVELVSHPQNLFSPEKGLDNEYLHVSKTRDVKEGFPTSVPEAEQNLAWDKIPKMLHFKEVTSFVFILQL